MPTISAHTLRRRRPASLRLGHDGSLACRHRDISCCTECAAAHPEVVEVYGVHYWVSDPVERAALVAEVASSSERPTRQP